MRYYWLFALILGSILPAGCGEQEADEIRLRKFSNHLFLVSWPVFEENGITPSGLVAYNKKMDAGLTVIGGNVVSQQLDGNFLFGKKEAFKSPFSDTSSFSEDWKKSGYFLVEMQQFNNFKWRGLDAPKVEWFSDEKSLIRALRLKK